MLRADQRHLMDMVCELNDFVCLPRCVDTVLTYTFALINLYVQSAYSVDGKLDADIYHTIDVYQP